MSKQKFSELNENKIIKNCIYLIHTLFYTHTCHNKAFVNTNGVVSSFKKNIFGRILNLKPISECGNLHQNLSNPTMGKYLIRQQAHIAHSTLLTINCY